MSETDSIQDKFPVPTKEEVEQDKLIDWTFTRHALTQVQRDSRMMIRATGEKLARKILSECPPCADRSAAMRKIREAIMTANAAIALEGKSI